MESLLTVEDVKVILSSVRENIQCENLCRVVQDGGHMREPSQNLFDDDDPHHDCLAKDMRVLRRSPLAIIAGHPSFDVLGKDSMNTWQAEFSSLLGQEEKQTIQAPTRRNRHRHLDLEFPEKYHNNIKQPPSKDGSLLPEKSEKPTNVTLLRGSGTDDTQQQSPSQSVQPQKSAMVPQRSQSPRSRSRSQRRRSLSPTKRWKSPRKQRHSSPIKKRSSKQQCFEEKNGGLLPRPQLIVSSDEIEIERREPMSTTVSSDSSKRRLLLAPIRSSRRSLVSSPRQHLKQKRLDQHQQPILMILPHEIEIEHQELIYPRESYDYSLASSLIIGRHAKHHSPSPSISSSRNGKDEERRSSKLTVSSAGIEVEDKSKPLPSPLHPPSESYMPRSRSPFKRWNQKSRGVVVE